MSSTYGPAAPLYTDPMAQEHVSDTRVLNRRTLARDHRILAALLRPGMRVLDVGCGTGAITVGIAHAVGTGGRVLGIDADAGMIDRARHACSDLRQLTFQHMDVSDLPFRAEFDIVTAARTLQWIPDRSGALARLRQACRPGGHLVILDYDHTAATWDPVPPAAFQRFYQAFLDWRSGKGLDNRIARNLPDLVETAGLQDVVVHDSSEATHRGDPEFEPAARIWLDVIESMGAHLVAAGLLQAADLSTARDAYATFLRDELQRQTLMLSTVVGSPSAADAP